jgi:hypothetical protein
MRTPLISVLTPVGPRHHDHVSVARASVAWQTIPADWVEHLVVYDTAGEGPAQCRNRALEQARGTFIVCLDADDYLLPTALETYVRGYARSRASYVYADNYVITANGQHSYSNSQEYDQVKQGHYNQHVVTALVPTALARGVGGFDTGVDIWEDWTLWLRLAMRGWCGQRLAQPALVYRVAQGERMARGLQLGDGAMAAVTRRYLNNKGQLVMCGCNQPAAAAQARGQAAAAVALLGAPAMSDNGLVRLEYTGAQTGGFYLTSQTTGIQYKLGGRRLVDADPRDVDWLISYGCVPVAAVEFTPPPETDSTTGSGVTSSDTPTEIVITPPPADGAPVNEPPPSDAPVITELVDIPEAPADGETFTPKRMRRRSSEEAA